MNYKIICVEQPNPSIGVEFIRYNDIFDDEVSLYSLQIYLWKYRVVFYKDY